MYTSCNFWLQETSAIKLQVETSTEKPAISVQKKQENYDFWGSNFSVELW